MTEHKFKEKLFFDHFYNKYNNRYITIRLFMTARLAHLNKLSKKKITYIYCKKVSFQNL